MIITISESKRGAHRGSSHGTTVSVSDGESREHARGGRGRTRHVSEISFSPNFSPESSGIILEEKSLVLFSLLFHFLPLSPPRKHYIKDWLNNIYNTLG